MSDSQYVYFSPDPSYCSHPSNFSAIGTQVLYRLDTKTGEFVEYLPFAPTSSQRYGLYTFEFSPNGQDLVYFQTMNSSVTIKIRNLASESETSFVLDRNYHEAGCLAWMDDGQHLLFYGATTTRPNKATSTSLYLVDIRQKSILEIYHDQPNVYCAYDEPYWRENLPNSKDLLVEKMDLSYSKVAERFYLNPLTKETLPWPTPTSWPTSAHQPTHTPSP